MLQFFEGRQSDTKDSRQGKITITLQRAFSPTPKRATSGSRTFTFAFCLFDFLVQQLFSRFLTTRNIRQWTWTKKFARNQFWKMQSASGRVQLALAFTFKARFDSARECVKLCRINLLIITLLIWSAINHSTSLHKKSSLYYRLLTHFRVRFRRFSDKFNW